MKEIVVISGKGGTGKTSITASFAFLAGKDIVVADCDVDAADMHLLLQPDFKKSADFFSGVSPEISHEICTLCGYCLQACHFNAMQIKNDHIVVLPLNCEGCGYCDQVCEPGAIIMVEQNIGEWYVSETKAGNVMVHARLGIGAENSGKLVAKVKNEAKRIAEETNKEFVLIDGSPGIGCPVVSSLSGAKFVVLVTEPSVSGLHDLKRVFQLVKKFNIPAGCIINKADLNSELSEKIKRFLKIEHIIHISNLYYDETFTKAMTNGKTLVEYSNGRSETTLCDSWEIIKQLTLNGGVKK